MARWGRETESTVHILCFAGRALESLRVTHLCRSPRLERDRRGDYGPAGVLDHYHVFDAYLTLSVSHVRNPLQTERGDCQQ